jgi:hypothetical protein
MFFGDDRRKPDFGLQKFIGSFMSNNIRSFRCFLIAYNGETQGFFMIRRLKLAWLESLFQI